MTACRVDAHTHKNTPPFVRRQCLRHFSIRARNSQLSTAVDETRLHILLTNRRDHGQRVQKCAGECPLAAVAARTTAMPAALYGSHDDLLVVAYFLAYSARPVPTQQEQQQRRQPAYKSKQKRGRHTLFFFVALCAAKRPLTPLRMRRVPDRLRYRSRCSTSRH